MKHRIWVAFILMIGIIISGVRYYFFVTDTIYEESANHLKEIYNQVNRSLYNLIGGTWRTMDMWIPYLEDMQDEKQISEYVERIKKDEGFTGFYFISREGGYCTPDRQKGYLNLEGHLSELIIDRECIAASAAMPSKPEMIVFAVPCDKNVYGDFEYEAIGISFYNSEIVGLLEISAFDDNSKGYVIYPDGRVIMDNADTQKQNIYNFIGMLEARSDLESQQIAEMQQDFRQGTSGVINFRMESEEYYLVYEPVEFEDWTVLGMVTADAVNAGMNKLQMRILVVGGGIFVLILIACIWYLKQRSRLSLEEKDTEIRYREELFSMLSNSVDHIFLILDGNTLGVSYISPNVEKILGISEKDVKKDSHVVDELLMGEGKMTAAEQLSELASGENMEWEQEYAHRTTGDRRWLLVSASNMEIQGKSKYIIIFFDRTKEKKINRALEEAAKIANDASSAKSRFLSNMSHDIRTPMNAVLGYTTLAAANIENREKLKDYLAKILSSGNHMLSLLNDILDMSRIENGKIHLKEAEENLPRILNEVGTIVSGQMQSKQLELHIEMMDITDENVLCDKTRLNQVLLNIVTNAVKFTEPGGSVSVLLVQEHNGPAGMGKYRIHIKDTGIGMSAEFAEKIFSPFEREQTSVVNKTQGTGLGMPIAKSIIDIMGGTIEIITEQGRGTEFIISLTFRLPPA
ncbi:MAG: ATP-binding protein [Firmicutes bacterium]|nr:ATP-binding protein [Bacillota bacterium]